MSAIMEQLDMLTVSEKMRIVEYLIKSISVVVVRQEDNGKKATRRIGVMDGKWKLPTWEEDKALDREIEADFEMSLERPL